MLNALSIDVEEWYHAELVRKHVADADRKPQAAAATRPILDLLDRYGAKATFFVVGEVARQSPDIVREIAARGHEIGCHTMSHCMLTQMTPSILSDELDQFGEVMSKLGISAVSGFRAPTFSLQQDTSWAIPILEAAGYRYDSSVFPMRGPLYGVAKAPVRPYRLGVADVSQPAHSGKLLEFPMTVWQLGPLRIPVSGGLYLRLLPTALLKAVLRRINAEGRPVVLYLHPWETYVGTPHVAELSAFASLATYTSIGRTLAKLESLMRSFSWSSMAEVISQWLAADHPGLGPISSSP